MPQCKAKEVEKRGQDLKWSRPGVRDGELSRVRDGGLSRVKEGGISRILKRSRPRSKRRGGKLSKCVMDGETVGRVGEDALTGSGNPWKEDEGGGGSGKIARGNGCRRRKDGHCDGRGNGNDLLVAQCQPELGESGSSRDKIKNNCSPEEVSSSCALDSKLGKDSCDSIEVDNGRDGAFPESPSIYKKRWLKTQNDRALDSSCSASESRSVLISSSVSGRGKDVFLGGSCNPTTWRKDVAIPLLESLSITYYNPQVGEWTSDLVAVERDAKDTAKILFYVLDPSTRNVVGIIEASNFASSQRRLVLVADSYRPGQSVANEAISEKEYRELSDGLDILKFLCSRRSIPVFHSITDAINHTSQLLGNERVETSQPSSVKVPDNLNHSDKTAFHPHSTSAFRQAFDSFDTTKSGLITLGDCRSAYKRLTNQNLGMEDIGVVDDDGQLPPTINFPEFCAILDRRNCSQVQSSSADFKFDLSLITSSSTDMSLTENVLKTKGIKYLIAEINNPIDLSLLESLESSRILVYLITSDTRGLRLMALASYHLNLSRTIILCLQDLESNAVVDDETLSPEAINDYNRGRTYLTDEAKRLELPIFTKAEEAVSEALKLLTASTNM